MTAGAQDRSAGRRGRARRRSGPLRRHGREPPVARSRSSTRCSRAPGSPSSTPLFAAIGRDAGARAAAVRAARTGVARLDHVRAGPAHRPIGLGRPLRRRRSSARGLVGGGGGRAAGARQRQRLLRRLRRGVGACWPRSPCSGGTRHIDPQEDDLVVGTVLQVGFPLLALPWLFATAHSPAARGRRSSRRRFRRRSCSRPPGCSPWGSSRLDALSASSGLELAPEPLVAAAARRRAGGHGAHRGPACVPPRHADRRHPGRAARAAARDPDADRRRASGGPRVPAELPEPGHRLPRASLIAEPPAADRSPIPGAPFGSLRRSRRPGRARPIAPGAILVSIALLTAAVVVLFVVVVRLTFAPPGRRGRRARRRAARGARVPAARPRAAPAAVRAPPRRRGAPTTAQRGLPRLPRAPRGRDRDLARQPAEPPATHAARLRAAGFRDPRAGAPRRRLRAGALRAADAARRARPARALGRCGDRSGPASGERRAPDGCRRRPRRRPRLTPATGGLRYDSGLHGPEVGRARRGMPQHVVDTISGLHHVLCSPSASSRRSCIAVSRCRRALRSRSTGRSWRRRRPARLGRGAREHVGIGRSEPGAGRAAGLAAFRLGVFQAEWAFAMTRPHLRESVVPAGVAIHGAALGVSRL